MKIEFECEKFDDLVFTVEGLEFRYTECLVLAERASKVIPIIDLVLKSPEGKYAEVIVRSHDQSVGKENIYRGYYVAELIGGSYAEESATLINVFN